MTGLKKGAVWGSFFPISLFKSSNQKKFGCCAGGRDDVQQTVLFELLLTLLLFFFLFSSPYDPCQFSLSRRLLPLQTDTIWPVVLCITPRWLESLTAALHVQFFFFSYALLAIASSHQRGYTQKNKNLLSRVPLFFFLALCIDFSGERGYAIGHW